MQSHHHRLWGQHIIDDFYASAPAIAKARGIGFSGCPFVWPILIMWLMDELVRFLSYCANSRGHSSFMWATLVIAKNLASVKRMLETKTWSLLLQTSSCFIKSVKHLANMYLTTQTLLSQNISTTRRPCSYKNPPQYNYFCHYSCSRQPNQKVIV